MSTPRDEIQRRIAEQERKRRGGLRGSDPILRPPPDTPATRAPTKDTGIPRAGATLPRPEPGLVTGAGGAPDPFKGGGGPKRPSPEPGLVTGSARRRPVNPGAAPTRSPPPTPREQIGPEGVARPSPEPRLVTGAAQRVEQQGRPVTLRDGSLTPEQVRPFPAQQPTAASGGGGLGGGDDSSASQAAPGDDFLAGARESREVREARQSEIDSAVTQAGQNAANRTPEQNARLQSDAEQFDARFGDQISVAAREAFDSQDQPQGQPQDQPQGQSQGERSSGLRRGSATFNIPQNAQVLSSSPGATINRVEPGTGRTIVTGDDGIERFQSTVIGGEPRRRGAGLRSSNAGPINTRLASGTGANGEPVFDNASIQRGIDLQDGTIPDPQAERERIARNQALDEQQRPQTLRNQLNAGLITQEQFNTETVARTAQQQTAAGVAEAQIEAQADVASQQVKAAADRRKNNTSQIAAQSQILGTVLPPGHPLREDSEAREGLLRIVNSQANTDIMNSRLSGETTPEDVALLTGIGANLAQSTSDELFGGYLGRNDANQPVSIEPVVDLIDEAALADPSDTRFTFQGREINLQRLGGMGAEATNQLLERARTQRREETATSMLLEGKNFDQLQGKQKQILERDFKAAKQRRLDLLEAQAPQTLSGRVAQDPKFAGTRRLNIPVRNPDVIARLNEGGVEARVGDTLKTIRERIEKLKPDAEFAERFALENIPEDLRRSLENG